MNADRDTLEDQLQQCEQKLGGLNSYIRELSARAAEHGTDSAHFEEDLFEAKHNVQYYEDAIGRIRAELKGLGKGTTPSPKGGGGAVGGGADSILPRTPKQGLGSLILSSISFVAGAVLGSRMQSRRGGKDAPEEKRGG